MSLEAALEKNTAALEENSKLLSALVAKAKASGVSTVKDGPADDGDAPKTRGRTAGSTNKPKADKVPTAADMKAAATGWLGEVEGDDDEYGRRRGEISKIIKKFKSDSFTKIPEEHRAAALKLLDEAKAADADTDDSGDEDDDI